MSLAFSAIMIVGALVLPEDGAGHGNPYVEIYRVIERSGTTVELSVDPAAANGVKFRRWNFRQGGQPRTVEEPKLKIDLKTHARVEAQFDRV